MLALHSGWVMQLEFRHLERRWEHTRLRYPARQIAYDGVRIAFPLLASRPPPMGVSHNGGSKANAHYRRGA